jgi:hypothetical protein
MIRAAALAGFSCSQIRTTRHPAFIHSVFVSTSRSRFRLNFAAHHARFAFGSVRCLGQLCQKQPSTKMAIFLLGNTISARFRLSGSTRRSIRNRKPALCSAARNASSGLVSRLRADCIRRRAPGDDAAGLLTFIRPHLLSKSKPF